MPINPDPATPDVQGTRQALPLTPTDPEQWLAAHRQQAAAQPTDPTLPDPEQWLAQHRQEPPSATSRFFSPMNPWSAVEQWWDRMTQTREDNNAMMDAMVTGLKVRQRVREGGAPATAEEQDTIDRGSAALTRQDVGNAVPPRLPAEIQPLVQAGAEARQGNLAGAAGHIVGGYVAPIVIGKALGEAADLNAQRDAILPAGSRAAQPGQTVRATIPVEPPPQAPPSGGGAAGGSVAGDIYKLGKGTVGAAMPGVGHAISGVEAGVSLAKRVANLVQRIKGETPGTRTIEFQVQPRPAPGWQNIPGAQPGTIVTPPPETWTPEPPEEGLPSGRTPGGEQNVPPPVTRAPRGAPPWWNLKINPTPAMPDVVVAEPTEAPTLPSGRVRGGEQNVPPETPPAARPQRPAPAWQNLKINPNPAMPDVVVAEPAQVPRLPSGRTVGSAQHGAEVSASSYFEVKPNGEVVEVPPPAAAPAPAPTPAQAPAAPAETPPARPTPEEQAAVFNPDKARFEAAQAARKAKAAAKGRTSEPPAPTPAPAEGEGETLSADEVRWVDKMADRLYADGQGLRPKQARALTMDQLDELAGAAPEGGKPLMPASGRTANAILRMHQRLFDRWAAGRKGP